MNDLFLSVVIPAYNEQGRIVPTLNEAVGYLAKQHYTWEIVVVDDGSTDDTARLVRQYAETETNVRIESVGHAGKGWAVRHGMLSAKGAYRLLCDADLATPIEQLEKFIDKIAEGYDLVIGSRQIDGAQRYDEPLMRHLMGRVFNWTVSALCVGGFKDTQCGFKLFRGDAAQTLFSLQTIRGFAFDVEVLYLTARNQVRVYEMPVDWHHKPESKVRAGLDSFLMARDALGIRLRDLRGGYKVNSDFDPCHDSTGSPALKGRTNDVPESEGVDKPVDCANIAVVVPTYNEADNLPVMTDRLFALGLPNMRVIVVDDNSPDGTADVAEKLSKRLDGRVDVIKRECKLGLGTAYVRGFAYALEQGADYILQMDADLSHAPEYIPDFLKKLEESDVVVGSRYTPGGAVGANWSRKRKALSSLANIAIRKVSGLEVKDVTSGFKAYRKSALEALNLSEFQCKGFGFQAEVAFACQRQGYRIAEYPIVFVDRTEGQSKMSVSIIFEAFWRLLLLRWRK